MALEYTITNKMISYVVSISEKIGRIKEIRRTHKHIDFDMLCTIRNIQNTLHYLEISYPDKYITQLISKDILHTNTLNKKDYKIIQKVVNLYIEVTKHKYSNIDSLVKEYNKSGLFRKVSIANIKNITERNNPSTSSNFFLYNITEFCCDSFYKMNDVIEEFLLITLFYREYGMILYLPYNKYFEQEKYIVSNKINHFDNAESLSQESNSKYPLYEFYLSIIDSIVEESVEVHYKLANPISGRVAVLQGTIKEPFSRKDYMAYYKLSGSAASKDLKEAVDKGILIIKGDKINARYMYKNNEQIELL